MSSHSHPVAGTFLPELHSKLVLVSRFLTDLGLDSELGAFFMRYCLGTRQLGGFIPRPQQLEWNQMPERCLIYLWTSWLGLPSENKMKRPRGKNSFLLHLSRHFSWCTYTYTLHMNGNNRGEWRVIFDGLLWDCYLNVRSIFKKCLSSTLYRTGLVLVWTGSRHALLLDLTPESRSWSTLVLLGLSDAFG